MSANPCHWQQKCSSLLVLQQKTTSCLCLNGERDNVLNIVLFEINGALFLRHNPNPKAVNALAISVREMRFHSLRAVFRGLFQCLRFFPVLELLSRNEELKRIPERCEHQVRLAHIVPKIWNIAPPNKHSPLCDENEITSFNLLIVFC